MLDQYKVFSSLSGELAGSWLAYRGNRVQRYLDSHMDGSPSLQSELQCVATYVFAPPENFRLRLFKTLQYICAGIPAIVQF